MKKVILGIAILLTCMVACAEEGYVSPESYAVNEDEMQNLYQQVTTVPAVTENVNKESDPVVKEKKSRHIKSKKQVITEEAGQSVQESQETPKPKKQKKNKKQKAENSDTTEVPQTAQPTEYNQAPPQETRAQEYSNQNSVRNGEPSPETYAVNEDEIEAQYYKYVTSPTTQTTDSIAKYNPEDDTEKGVKATLRRIRYNSMDPHHGELHQIKVEASNKFEGK